jgi:hypothetical protein
MIPCDSEIVRLGWLSRREVGRMGQRKYTQMTQWVLSVQSIVTVNQVLISCQITRKRKNI